MSDGCVIMPLNSGAKCVTQLGHFAKKREELGRHILDRRWQGLLCLHGTTVVCVRLYFQLMLKTAMEV